MNEFRVTYVLSKAFAIVAAAALSSGCASSPPPPGVYRVHLVPHSAPPVLDVSGLPGGKVTGAGVGAGTGSGAGIAVGAAACAATGPLFPLCLAAVLPTTLIVGAASGAVIGAIRTESQGAIELRTAALKSELAATPYAVGLSARIKDLLGEAGAIAVVEPADAEADAAWSMDVAVIEVGTEGKRDFAVRLVTQVALRRGAAATVWQIKKEVQSETELTTAEWMANDARALRGVLDLCVHQAARHLVADLTRAPSNPRPATRYSSSCKDVPAQWELVARS